MGASQRRSVLVGLILLAWGQSAFGGTYADPSGFSVTFPDGWTAVTRVAMADVKQALSAELKEGLSRHHFDLDQIAVLLVRESDEEFLENVNVIVKDQQIPVGQKTVQELTTVIPKQMADMGMTVERFQASVQKVGSRDAVVIEYQSRMSDEADMLRQKQVLFPGGGKSYIVTCTAPADAFDQYQPTFDGMLASFQAPAPVAQGFDWNEIARRSIVGGVIGGFVGGLTWIVRKFSGKGRNEPKPPESPGSSDL